MTSLTTTAVRSLVGILGVFMSASGRPAAPWLRSRPSEAELEQLRIAETHRPSLS